MSTIERRVGGTERFDGYADAKEQFAENKLCYFNLFVTILPTVIICFHFGCSEFYFKKNVSEVTFLYLANAKYKKVTSETFFF